MRQTESKAASIYIRKKNCVLWFEPAEILHYDMQKILEYFQVLVLPCLKKVGIFKKFLDLFFLGRPDFDFLSSSKPL